VPSAMSSDLVANLFFPARQLVTDALRLTLDALSRAGFATGSLGGGSVADWAEAGGARHRSRTLSEALAAFDLATTWTVLLTKRLASDDATIDPAVYSGVTLGFSRAVSEGRGHFDRLTLSRSMPDPSHEPTVAAEFLAWATFVPELTGPWYGWGGDEIGLLGPERYPLLSADLTRLDPQPIQWLNIYGPAYVERFGWRRLLSAPAWRVEFLANGGGAVVLGPTPDSADTAAAVATHLGIPGP
jgi:hypothetical protein